MFERFPCGVSPIMACLHLVFALGVHGMSQVADSLPASLWVDKSLQSCCSRSCWRVFGALQRLSWQHSCDMMT